MLLRNSSEIYEAIEANIPSHFFFDKDTVIYVWDCVQKKSYKTFVPPKMLNILNKTHPFERGMILYEYISGKY
jgi:hypothetical protein